MLMLLDRDGVINVDLSTGIRSVKEFQLIPGSATAIAQLNAAHIPVAIITNQALVGRGEISLQKLHDIHDHMNNLLRTENAHVDHIFYCTDTTVEPNKRRKPAPGMVLEAMQHFKAHPNNTLMIGDALRDVQAAQAAGCQAILVKTGKGQQTLLENFSSLDNVKIYDDLYYAVQGVINVD